MSNSSVKGRFMGRYGNRDQALAALVDPSTSHYDANTVIKNPNLTHADLDRIASEPGYWQQHARNEYFNRYGVMHNAKTSELFSPKNK